MGEIVRDGYEKFADTKQKLFALIPKKKQFRIFQRQSSSIKRVPSTRRRQVLKKKIRFFSCFWQLLN